MNRESPFHKAARAIAFGRRVPLTKIARRIELDVKRRVALPRRAAASGEPTVPPLAEHLPPPLFPGRSGALERAGDRLRIRFVGQTYEIGPRIDWMARREEPGSQLWRMNLHYMEYLEEVDDALLADLVLQWIAGNPPYLPEYWKDSWNSYALSLRVVVWMQQFALRVDRLDRRVASALVASVAQQIRFLESNLETDIGGNHLVKNIKALIYAGHFFLGAEADRWRATGLRLLESELPRQIFADGMHFERSASYHCQVFADLLECRFVIGYDPFGGALDDALSRMVRVTADMAHPDGGVALFNDAGLSMAYSPRECLDIYAYLFGCKPSPRRVFALTDAGYFGLRWGAFYLIADCGRIAPDDLPAHGHGDVLSFELSVGGQRIIVDQGVFEYVAGERRRLARATSCHNTLCIGDSDQGDFFGAFRCGARPDVTLRSYRPTADGFRLEGSHNGFARLPGSPIPFRRFSVRPGEVLIHDRVKGRTDAPITIGFLLHPDARADVSGPTARIVCHGIEMRIACTSSIVLENAVWWPDMGREVTTTRLRLTLAAGVYEATTRLRVVTPAVGR
jgi:hypothetical protein